MRRIACALACAAVFAAAAGEARAAADGQWAFVDGENGTDALVTLNPITRPDLAGGEHTIYTAPAGDRINAPQWSPDGNRIAFAETGPGGSRILVYDLADGQVSQVAPDGAAPSWSPDGARIAFVRAGALVTRTVAGGDEQPLPVDGAGVRDVAWSPDGDLLALWVGDHIDLASLDGQDRETIGDHAVGGAAWTPDSSSLVYSWGGTGGTALLRVSLATGSAGFVRGVGEPAGTDIEPDFAPNGVQLVYTHHDEANPGPTFEVVAPGELWTGGLRTTLVPSQPDWQPCVAGVTATCTSTSPPFAGPPAPACPASTALTAVAGVGTRVVDACTHAFRYEVVDPPAHGTVTPAPGANGLSYRAASTFSGQDTFTYRALGHLGTSSAVARVVVTVTPRPLRPAAPRLALPHRPRLDRHRRVLVRGTCDRACTVKLHLRIRLRSGRVVNGRSVTATAPAGGRVALRLRSGKLPRHPRMATVHAVGRLVGADRLERAFDVAVAH